MSKLELLCFDLEVCCEQFINIFFDIFAALVSISDIVTDVIVTYQFYQHNRTVFFGLSLSFIILAQLSYIFAFIIQNGDETKPFRIFLMGLFLLPFSPIISFIFYLTEDPHSFTSYLLQTYFPFEVNFKTTRINAKKSKLRQWMKKKLRKHLGFIMESLIEAFPQSIIQLTAIVIYKEANIVSIISILISMLSVSSKSFILSIQLSINIKTLFFNWLCAVTDFIGIFFAVSWAFYDSEYATISMISTIWQMKLLFTVIPLVFCISVGFYYKVITEIYKSLSDTNSIIYLLCWYFSSFLMVTGVWAFGLVLGILALEISTFLWIAFPMFVIGSIRMPTNAESNKLWLNILSWIKSSQTHKYDNIFSLTKKQDKIIRICCINQIMIDNRDNQKSNRIYTSFDSKFVDFINSHAGTSYMNIKSLSELRIHHDTIDFVKGPSPEFLSTCFALMGLPYLITKGEVKNNNNMGIWEKNIIFYAISFVNFMIAPFYYLSRIINIAFPFVIFVILYLNNISIFDVGLFQTVTLLMYVSFILILFILGIPVMIEQYYLWHIMPTKELSNKLIVSLEP
eukprot:24738_1